MSNRGRWRAGVVAASGLALAVGCSLVTSYDGFVKAGPTCGKRIPDRPAPGKGTTGPELLGAATALQFVQAQDAAPLGYDLDKLCTCPDRRACANPQATGQQCDIPNTGIDNAAGQILAVLYPPQANSRLQDSLTHGKNGLIVRVQDWDGTANDADVKVSIYNVVGLKGDEDGGAPARLDGNDEFIVDEASLLNPQDLGSRFFDTSAYVANGVLVASLDFDFRLEVPNLLGDAASPASVTVIPLTTARLVGKIERVGASGLRMTGAQLVGRLPIDRIFADLPSIGLCQNNPGFAQIRGAACAALDLPVSPAQDGKNGVCDALSFAIGVSVGPARLGGHAVAPGVSNPCGVEPTPKCQ